MLWILLSFVWNIGIVVAEVGFSGGGVASCFSWIIASMSPASISLYCFSPNPDDMPIVIDSKSDVKKCIVQTLYSSGFLSVSFVDKVNCKLVQYEGFVSDHLTNNT